MKAIEKSEKLIPDKVIGFKLPPVKLTIDPKETILYALNIGFNQDQLNTKHFKFTYEQDEEFSVFPIYPSVYKKNLYTLLYECESFPKFERHDNLHAEEWIEIVNPLPTSGEVLHETQIVDLEDKRKGTMVCFENRVKGIDNGTLYSVIYSNIYVKNVKGEGVKSNGIIKGFAMKNIPKENPLKEVTLKTFPNQALYYRMGSYPGNAHSVDPKVSAEMGYEKPILQALSYYSMTAKAAYENYCEDQIDNFLSFKARFSSPVYPGDTLSIKFWKNTQNSLLISVSTIERKVEVLRGEITIKNPKF